MDEKQKDLIIEFTYKHFGDDAEYVLTNYPLTGPNGIRRMLGEMDKEFFCKAYLPDQFEREFADYSRIILDTLGNIIESDIREKQAVIAPREHGKALEVNTPILTSKGWKTHSTLKVDDFVYNHLGEKVKVVHVQTPYMHNCMKLTLDTKDSFTCAKEHEWVVEINRDKRVGNKRNGKRIGRQTEIVETQNIFNGYQVDSPAIQLPKALKNCDIKLPIDPYLLGVWLGDGYSESSRISCGKEDIKHFSALGKVTKTSNAYYVTVKGLVTLLKKYNLYKNKHIPEIYFNASKKQRFELLKGLMDTDGTVNKNRAQCAFTNINKKLIDGVLTLCRSLNIKAKIRAKDAMLYGRYISKAYEVGFTASKTDKIFNLQRKQSRIDNKTKIEHADKKRYFIKKIVDIEDTFVNCISVEGGVYLAGRGLIPTHNSTFSSFAIPAWAALYKKKNFIFFISSNGDISANFLAKTKKALESSEIIEDFGIQKGRSWNAEEICLRNGVWIACSGWKAGLRGLNKDTRPDLIILDDLEDKGTIESDSLRRKLETCFNEEIGRLGTYNTDYFYIGTLLSEDSLLKKVTKMPSWKSLILKRVISFPKNEQLWEDWKKIYRDIVNENRFEDAWKFYVKNKDEMLEGSKILWEDKVPADKTKYYGGYYNVMLDREAFGEDAFWKEDQSEPRNSSDRPFKKQRYWQGLYDEPPKIENLKLTIDPSEGKGLDNTSYTLGGYLNGAVIVRDGQLKNHKLKAIMEHTAWFITEYPEIDEVIFEENTYKEDGTEQLRQYLVEKGCYRKVTGFRSTTNKHNRIMQMEPDMNNGNILFNNLNDQYNNEVLMYHAKAKHDDAPDSLQKLWQTLKKPNYYMA